MRLLSRRLAGLPLLACLAITVSVGAASAAAANRVAFDNSCAATVQDDFSRGITLLHSFEYPETEKIFRAIIDAQPDCAMAYWGVAMSLWHPLWAPPGAVALEEGARILAGAAEREKTPREAAYIDALQSFFSSADPATHRERNLAYTAKMSEVYASYLDDPEAAMFYALALLSIADPHDKSYRNQLEAAGLLDWVRMSQPTQAFCTI